MELVEFFRTVITSEGGWFCLAHAQIRETEEETKSTWKEQFYSWPDETDKIINRVRELGDKTNIYFSPYLFSQQQSLKEYAIVGKTIVADLDEAQILTLPLKPNVLVETSPDRHQGYWILKDEIDRDEHELLSKKVSYSIPRCDRTGWFLGKKVRIPTTYNHKYSTGAKYIRIADVNDKKYDAQQIEELYVDESVVTSNAEFIENNIDWAKDCIVFDVSPIEMLAKVRASSPSIARIYGQYNILSTDRSTALWALMTSLFRVGLKKEYVFYIAYNCVNNKFKDLRYGGIKELAKDVLRAELSIKLQTPDIKGKILSIRKLPGDRADRCLAIANIIKEYLERMGSFIHADNESAWFVREDTGKPVQITYRSPALETMIESLFGINCSEHEYTYTIRMLYAYVMEAPVNGRLENLSFYDTDEKVFMLHTGKKDILLIKNTGIERVNNGYNGVLFPWSTSTRSAISPKYQILDSKWDDILFGDCLDNIVDLKKADAQAILKVWFLTVLLRNGLASRPTLALFGQPGCIAGSTKLDIRRGEHSSREYTIEHLYRSAHGNWDLNIKNRIRSVKDGIVKWRNIANIINSGVKETFTVKIEGRNSFRTTADHLFLTPLGYKKLSELKSGDTVVVEDDIFYLDVLSEMNYTTTAQIESIESYGKEPTYDIQMEDEEAPNFLINGVVVHNSGKSTLFKRVYVLMYGRSKTIGAITKEDNFDMAVSTDPLVVMDNVDSYLSWLPDRLAVMVSPNEFIKRRLYTDSDTVTIKRNAMLGITAHAPKFGREDVTDRLLLLNFERLTHFKSDSEILDKIEQNRNGLWGNILQDIQIVLNTKMPKRGYPQFRVEDFAIYGYWIATALGIDDEFCDGIETIRKSQKNFILEEDSLLLEALTKFVAKEAEKGKDSTDYKTAGQLWIQLQSYSSDASTFMKRYKNSVSLGKKLWTLMDALREEFDIDVVHDTRRGSRSWSFSKKEVENVRA